MGFSLSISLRNLFMVSVRNLESGRTVLLPLLALLWHTMKTIRIFAKMTTAGGYGAVYNGIFSTGVPVAIKVLNGSSDKKIEEQFLAEVNTIGRTHHFNLIHLYGFCFDRGLPALVYEYMENGSLDRLLFHEHSHKLHEIAVGTAKGIAYLHEYCQQRIIHYDIKPANIHLDANFCPKVSDFGLAKLCNRENMEVMMTGSRRPRESCFGMLLFEIMGRKRNLDVNLPDSQEWFPRWVWKKFKKGQFQEVMVVCVIEEDKQKADRLTMADLSCFQYRQELRPWMNAVVRMLEGGVEIVTPFNPFKHLMVKSPRQEPVIASTTSGERDQLLSQLQNGPCRCSTPIMMKYEID
ncbi:hypothetical protein HHK36_021122 [Tetracentron sinense]|uniref:Protein kinase domain-containing protein n=1 Tax=Tetracentron sinense TaxID=13715 RepID=A0A835D6S7_TETSI|nr:hypothetical protein HHK36_021122 [Tetracentron sinense]